MTAPGGREITGIGLCLGTAGAVMVVARQYPLRLAAVAAMTWPAELWWSDPPPRAMSAGRRVLARARHRLGLPRWFPVAVVAGPSLSPVGTPDWVPPRSAQLLARAGLAQGWVVAPDWAAMLRATTGIAIAAELFATAAGPEAQLAVGAAIAVLLPPDTAWGGQRPGWAGAAGSAVDRAAPAGIAGEGVAAGVGGGVAAGMGGGPATVAEPDGIGKDASWVDGAFGWAVQRTGETGGAPVDGVPSYSGPAGSTATRLWLSDRTR